MQSEERSRVETLQTELPAGVPAPEKGTKVTGEIGNLERRRSQPSGEQRLPRQEALASSNAT